MLNLQKVTKIIIVHRTFICSLLRFHISNIYTLQFLYKHSPFSLLSSPLLTPSLPSSLPPPLLLCAYTHIITHICICAFIYYIHMYVIFLLNHLRVSFIHHGSLPPKYFSMYLLRIKGIFLCNNSNSYHFINLN